MAIVLPRGLINPPPPVVSQSPDGVLRAHIGEDGSGVLLEADFSTGASPSDPEPYQVRFLRRTSAGDAPVRSGDPAWSPRGQAVAYDHEVPFDVGVSWVAVPVFRDGVGAESDLVSLRLPGFTSRDEDVWLKALDQPQRSMKLRLLSNDLRLDSDSQSTVTSIPGSTYPNISVGRNTQQQRTFLIRTRSLAERDILLGVVEDGRLGLLDEPVLLWQIRTAAGIHDFYAATLSASESYPYRIESDPKRDVLVTVRPVARPATVDAPLFVPGRSYDEAGRVAGTYDEASSIWPTYADAVRL